MQCKVQSALCTVHCAKCTVQGAMVGAVARQEVVTGRLPRDPYIPTSPTIGSKLSTPMPAVPVPNGSNLADLKDSTPAETSPLSLLFTPTGGQPLSWSSTQTFPASANVKFSHPVTLNLVHTGQAAQLRRPLSLSLVHPNRWTTLAK